MRRFDMFWKTEATEIHRAALDGDILAVERLCNGSRMAVVLNSELEYPIFSALFLSAGATDEVKQKKIAIFRYLAQHQSDNVSYLVQQNTSGETILHKIASNGFDALVDEVIQQAPALLYLARQDRSYPIHVAVLNGRVHVAEKLLLQAAGVAEQTDAYGNLPLHLAAAYGSVEMTKVCLEAFPGGMNQSNDRSQTPLDLAKQHNNIAVRDFLVEKNATEDPMNGWLNTQSPSSIG